MALHYLGGVERRPCPVWQSIQGTEHNNLSADFDGEYPEPFNRAVNPDAEAQETMTKLQCILIAQFSRDE